MDYIYFFKEIFEYIEDYRQIVFLIYLIKNDSDLLKECGILKSEFTRLSLDFKTFLLGQKEDCLDDFRIEQDSIVEEISNR